MDDLVGKICPVCKQEIIVTENVKVCPDCGIPHHAECWKKNGGCSTFGCSQQGVEKADKVAVVCIRCGTELEADQAFCPKCGIPRGNVCIRCGNELTEGQEFCPKCGQKAGVTDTTNVSSAVNQIITRVTKRNNKKMTSVIIAVVAVLAIAIIAILMKGLINREPNFKRLYAVYCKSPWASVGSDGSYLSIDTNPYDEDDDGLAYYEAYTTAKKINQELGLPDSLFVEFGETTGLDGKQSEDFPSQRVTVQWKYHPDKGLEITYKKYKK